MQFPNPFKKEKPAEQPAEASRIEPQLGGAGESPAPWDVREDPPAFRVVGEEKPLESEVSPAPGSEPAEQTASQPQQREPVFVEPRPSQDAPSAGAHASPESGLVIGDIGSAPAPDAPRRPEPEQEAAAESEAPVQKTRLKMPAFGFMRKKAVAGTEADDEVPDEEILLQHQRTRYKLVGAAALMLGVIVVAPLVLDKEQDAKPPVSTEIPAVPEKARTTLDAVPGSSGEVDVTENSATKDQSTSRANLANEARQPVKAEAASGTAPAQGEAKPESGKTAEKTAEKTVAKSGEKAAAKKSPAADAKGFYVQVLATSSERNAERLVKELAAKGYPAYKVSVNQKAGTLWRVRVGNYSTRDEARGVQGTLVLDGHTGKLIVGNNP